MARLWLKGCPLCQGDLFEEAFSDPDDAVNQPMVTCLQCGHVLSEAEEACLRNEHSLRSSQPRGAARAPLL